MILAWTIDGLQSNIIYHSTYFIDETDNGYIRYRTDISVLV